MNYEELGLLVEEFQCGVYDIDNQNEGTKITVELRLYEVEEPSEENGNSWNVETGNYAVITTNSYTFGE